VLEKKARQPAGLRYAALSSCRLFAAACASRRRQSAMKRHTASHTREPSANRSLLPAPVCRYGVKDVLSLERRLSRPSRHQAVEPLLILADMFLFFTPSFAFISCRVCYLIESYAPRGAHAPPAAVLTPPMLRIHAHEGCQRPPFRASLFLFSFLLLAPPMSASCSTTKHLRRPRRQRRLRIRCCRSGCAVRFAYARAVRDCAARVEARACSATRTPRWHAPDPCAADAPVFLFPRRSAIAVFTSSYFTPPALLYQHDNAFEQQSHCRDSVARLFRHRPARLPFTMMVAIHARNALRRPETISHRCRAAPSALRVTLLYSARTPMPLRELLYQHQYRKHTSFIRAGNAMLLQMRQSETV